MKGKTIDDILREEFLKERAVVLGRTGESVARAIARLQHLAQIIENRHQELRRLDREPDGATECHELRTAKESAVNDINSKIAQYNRLWDHAQLRYYYLIVTREAMGLRSHHRVEEIYRIPPKKKQLSGG
ncbi:MAG TPA: hypothetical protein PLT63_03910 [Syntrophales bacterium]|jgi:hypothetical protein|nr:hypothetical protein [Syntrophales bacterium]HOD97902.1 hypothetical protein [Syntrophales bacterium]